MQIKPDLLSSASKKAQIEEMFDAISPKYDFLNRALSLGIDRIWRKKAIESLREIQPKLILDVATGTGDLAIEALKLHPERVTGIDISEGMLSKGRVKLQNAGITNIELIKGDSEKIAFGDNTFDAVTVAFGVRNFENLTDGLKEMNRVMRVGGKIAILEFSKPTVFPVKQFYNFYFKRILPTMGNKLSKSKNAYTYLPESVGAFPDGNEFLSIMTSSGYKNCSQRRFMFGICTLYNGSK